MAENETPISQGETDTSAAGTGAGLGGQPETPAELVDRTETTGAESALVERPDLTAAELREWLRSWVAEATGQPVEQITVDRPMEEFGLASRDAIALAGDVEDLTGVVLTATVVYQNPTISSLAQRIIEGEPEVPEDTADSTYYTSAVLGDAHDVAIVGFSTRFPKAGRTPQETWEFLIGGGDGISDLPPGRWTEFTSDPEIAAAVEKANTRGGYLDDVKGFDAEFFAMSPREVEWVDPQQRLALELTWEALEHARIPASELKGKPVGVFIGTSTNDYSMLAALEPTKTHAYSLTGAATSIVANRVSYFYDFRGPSVAIDTACSSTLVAVHQAVRALRGGEADVAVVGGVNMLLAPAITLGFDSVGAVAPDGHIKAFSSDADGMVRSEGGGLFVLKRLEDAERDGDNILAVVAGTAVNSDGRSNGLLAPNPDAQADVLRHAYRDAGIVPTTVDYIEAHGTGTILGDPIEADALGRVVGRGRDDDKPALLGSVKSNFGHLESAAGAASLAKIVLALQENKLPPSLNYAGPNPYIAFDKAHLQVIPEPTDWPRYSGNAIAGVSGFGFGGTNAHVVVKEYVPAPVGADVIDADADETAAQPDVLAEALDTEVDGAHGAEVDGAHGAEVDGAHGAEQESEREEPLPVLLAVSGAIPSRRRRAAAELADWLETETGSTTPLADIGRALAKRNHGRSRAVVLATTHADAVTGMRAVANGKPAAGVFSNDAPATQGPVWVLSGFGAQHRKMGKQLYLENAVFRAAIDEVDELIVDEAGYSVREMILDDEQDYDVGTSQVGIFAIQVGLAVLLRHHGAEPAAVVGHSMGEVAAAYISGGLDLVDAVRVICARSRLMGEGEATLSGDDIRRMALVEYSAEEIIGVLGDFPDLEVAVYAAPTHTVIGGPEPQVNAIVERAEAEGKLARVLATKGAGHTSQMDPLLGELAAELAGLEPNKPKVGVYSTVDKETFYRAGHDPIHTEDYWVRNMRQSVYFTNAVRVAVETGHSTYLELAPNPVALMQVAATTFAAGMHDAQLIQTLKRKEDESLGVLTALAQLYVVGHDVSLASLFEAGGYGDIPRTAFVRKPYWTTGRLGGGSGNNRIPGAHVAMPDGRHAWEVQAGVVTDLGALVTAAAAQVLSDATLGAAIPHGDLSSAGTLTTTLTPHPGGASVQVHAREDAAFRLVYDAVVTGGPAVAVAGTAAQNGAGTAAQNGAAFAPVQAPAAEPSGLVEELPEVIETFSGRWDPNGSQTLEDRLAYIVAESMGYAPEDLPAEIPLIELGLDSLMAVRIKNRVEYEFDIPQLQLQAVRDANLVGVGKYLRYAVENRDEVQALADQQQAEREAADASDAAGTGAPTENVESRLDDEDTSVQAEAEAILEQAEQPAPAPEAAVSAEVGESDISPRDPAERLTFATWAVVTGESAKGVQNTLPILEEEVAEKLAARLSERTKSDITVDDVLDAETIEQLAEVVRRVTEGIGLDGFVRALRARPEGSTAVPVFAFHPSGSTTVVYEPLLKRLPTDTPMYGIERVEGDIEERARQYLPELRKIQGNGPYVLYGWSLGAVLAFAVAKLLRAEGADVRIVGMIDLALPVDRPAEGPAAARARIERYASFANKTYGVDTSALPLDRLSHASDDEQVQIIMDMIKLSGANVPASMIEHERTSWIDSRALAKAEATHYDGDVVLYLADRYHDGMIELEPAYKNRAPNGGWDEHVPNLEVIHVGGDHVQIIDEPYIAKIGADLTKKLGNIQ
ncbi:polyketide synthase Pks13 [Aldersonia sp. NBC_00410]|uniref:polyketide synthase Pks13 n=1 Tax=Aldersonia sp. NBC_00410 TaxID=2975954 RepID=UPI0022525DDF|nr:polyketide synthase Pks13 [Aldersonia sp. NBC_00410]MCX5042238.1 polyketide synthase Pks13 [Aldersonia sp. NBC_00410]